MKAFVLWVMIMSGSWMSTWDYQSEGACNTAMYEHIVKGTFGKDYGMQCLPKGKLPND